MAVQYNNRLRGRTVMVLPAGCSNNVVVTMGHFRQKSKSSTFPWAGGGGGGQGSQMTSA